MSSFSLSLSHYVIMCFYPLSPQVVMDYVGEEYFRLRNLIIKHERYILKVCIIAAACVILLINFY